MTLEFGLRTYARTGNQAALDQVLTGQRYALVVIDPITNYLGPVKSHNDADVRRVLTPLVALLDRHKVAGLSLMHPPKTSSSVLAYFAGGSVAFGAVPRVTLGAAQDPDDDRPVPRRLLVKLKGNLYGAVPSLAYQITAHDDASTPWLVWAPEPVGDVPLERLFGPSTETAEERSQVQACRAWLRAELASVAKDATAMETAARHLGFAPKTVKRARIGLVWAVRVGGLGAQGKWVWDLRVGAPAGRPGPGPQEPSWRPGVRPVHLLRGPAWNMAPLVFLARMTMALLGGFRI
jgi:hypothetical protein